MAILNFKTCFSKMNRKLRPTKSLYQLKDEQVNFLLEDIEKNLEHKKIIETKYKQLPEAKKKDTVRGKKKTKQQQQKKNPATKTLQNKISS